MQNLAKLHSIALAAFSLAGLTACGGGDSPPSPFTGDGLYGGTLTGTNRSTFRVLVLENGEIWAFIGDGAPGSFVPQGFLEGPATFENGTVASTSVRDFRFGALSGSSLATASGTYSEADRRLSLRIAYATATFTFNGAAVSSSEYNYSAPASLADVAGSWGLSASGLESVDLTISPSGSVMGATGSGCQFSGTFRARPSGRNVFDVTFTFAASPPCVPGGRTLSGVAMVLSTSSGGSRLTVAFRDTDRTMGFLATGTR